MEVEHTVLAGSLFQLRTHTQPMGILYMLLLPSIRHTFCPVIRRIIPMPAHPYTCVLYDGVDDAVDDAICAAVSSFFSRKTVSFIGVL